MLMFASFTTSNRVVHRIMRNAIQTSSKNRNEEITEIGNHFDILRLHNSLIYLFKI